ncbi:hypothetical protein L3Q82_005592 [Scortum barcoo]|uniref:Uncharacterized protein n=1 Tax=Scortum barcoo TaxID=214431 RepID=A0ACB8V6G3_9TELE|nr:hypothetical protein L3Q82_005592 [Scortum barcoo]
MIDFVVVSSDLRPYVLDTRVKRGAELSTDHHLVVSWLRWQRRKLDRPGRPKRIVRVCWERLAKPSVREVFNSHLRKSFSQIPREARLGTLSPSGPCSLPPLSTRQFGKLWTQGLWCLSWWQSPNPVVDTGSKGCRQAEEEKSYQRMRDHVGLWDSWTQLTGSTYRQAKQAAAQGGPGGTSPGRKKLRGLGGVR